MSLQNLVTQVAGQFQQAYGRAPQWMAAAPGRVNIIGEHTDYNDGFVLPMAIERYTVVAAAPGNGQTVHLSSSAGQDPVSIDLATDLRPAPKGSWFNYPLGVIAGFADLGATPPGLNVLIHSTVPLGGGLSSSAALEVSTATLLEAVTGKQLEPVAKALLCQRAEHEYAGMPCGIMDQFISVMGKENHLLLLDCRSRKPELVPMMDPEVAVLIANTNVKHELTGGEYAQRRAQCEEAARALGVPSLRDASLAMLDTGKSALGEVVYRRARHVITEIERTVAAAEAIRKSNWREAGRLMYASHDSLRDDYEVSCSELDAIVEIAQQLGLQEGVIGCRMTGGGFGGCAVALVKTEAVSRISDRIATEYGKRTKIEPSIFVSRPAEGASRLR